MSIKRIYGSQLTINQNMLWNADVRITSTTRATTHNNTRCNNDDKYSSNSSREEERRAATMINSKRNEKWLEFERFFNMLDNTSELYYEHSTFLKANFKSFKVRKQLQDLNQLISEEYTRNNSKTSLFNLLMIISCVKNDRLLFDDDLNAS